MTSTNVLAQRIAERRAAIAAIPSLRDGRSAATAFGNSPEAVLRMWDQHHDDTKYWKEKTTLYFDVKGKEISKAKFDRQQAILDHAEARRLGYDPHRFDPLS